MSDRNRSSPEEQAVETRRAALLKMGRYAAYTAPVMTALPISSRADAAVSGRGCRGVNQGTSNKFSTPNPAHGHNEHPIFGHLRRLVGKK